MRGSTEGRVHLLSVTAACVSLVGCSSSHSSHLNPIPRQPDASIDGAVARSGTFSAIGTPVKISDRFYFTEGPVWDPAAGVLYFTDINGDPAGTPPVNGSLRPDASSPDVTATDGTDAGAGDDGSAMNAAMRDASGNDAGGADASAPAGHSVGGAIYRLTPPAAIDVFMQPIGNADGLGLDPDGHLLAAGFVSRDVWRLSDTGAMTVLSPCDSGGGTCYQGTEINTPDDITARSDGTLYFTDPTFGSGSQGFPTLRLPLQGAQGVYRVTPDGDLHLEDSSSGGPNGVNLSPDEKTLFVSYSLSSEVAKFEVADDGSLSNKTTFATGLTVADSMCVDSDGNLYVGTLSGLAVFDATGTHLGTISVDRLIVTNCAFGGADQRTLYITTRTTATLAGAPPLGGGSLYAISDMPVSGMPGRN